MAFLAAQARATGRPLSFDSAALIDYAARNEPIAGLLAPLLLDPTVLVVVSTVALAELVGWAAQAGDADEVGIIHSGLRRLPGLTIIDFAEAQAIETAFVRAQTGLKLPDAAIAATARLANAGALLGNDRQWRGKALGIPYHHLDHILVLP